MTRDLVLKHYWRSSCSWRVRWALEIKGLAYRKVHVDLLAGEHLEQNYRQQNPLTFVPTLIVDGKPYFESLAIIEWLDEVYRQQPLLPADQQTRLIARQLAYLIACAVQPLQNMATQRHYSTDRQAQQRYARHYIERGFQAYEQRLTELGSTSFSVSEQLTVADLCLIPQVYNAKRFNCDLKPFPKIEQIYHHCRQTTPCHRSSPEEEKRTLDY